MNSAAKSPIILVRYSRQGKESVWSDYASRDVSDGPGAALELRRRFTESAGRVGAPNQPRLRVVPARPGGPQIEVAPVLGQSLAAFLEHACRDDHGAFELRAEFDAPFSQAFVLVRVAFPGTAPAPASGSSAGDPSPMLIEQFECSATSTVADLKHSIEMRTRFPRDRMVLLLGCKRLNSELQMSRVAAAAQAAGTDLQMHLAAEGAYVFLRREGQGHCEPTGPATLTLHLPPSVQASRVRPMKFDPTQSLDDFRFAVQASSGLPPACLQFKIIAQPELAPIDMKIGAATLERLGFYDGCAVEVTTDFVDSATAVSYELPLDTPATGSAAVLYERAAEKLGLQDASRLSLFVSKMAISRTSDLACAPFADGVILAAYSSWPFQISYTVLTTTSSGLSAEFVGRTSEGASSSSAHVALDVELGDSSTSAVAKIACLTSDTIEEVRERIIGASATDAEQAGKLRRSKIFAVESSAWASGGSACTSLSALSKLLGHFSNCSSGARLSRLGIADGCAHLVLVPEQTLHVEILIHFGSGRVVPRHLRVPSSTRLSELSKVLEKSLQEQPVDECPALERAQCHWAVAPCPEREETSPSRSPTEEASMAAAPARGVVAMVGTAAAAVVKRRKSLGGGSSREDSPGRKPAKKRRISLGSTPRSVDELCGDEFLGDLRADHPVQQMDVPSHLLCPISMDLMRDPVVVNGSGNTYDRKSIEKHFEQRFTDPITNVELRRSSDRRLVPNHAIRSLVIEAERSFVDLRLVAFIGERPRRAFVGDAGMASSLQWFTSLLRGSP